jgi:hypothetical protein
MRDVSISIRIRTSIGPVLAAQFQHWGLTVNVHRREDNAMQRSDGREQQCACQTGIPEPVRLAREDACRNEDIVP